MMTHILTGNFATDEAASLDNEAHAIDPSVFLPQKNTALVHKSKTATSIARIGTMQDVEDLQLCYHARIQPWTK